MKLLLIATLFSLPAWACKPAPIEICESKTFIKLEMNSFTALKTAAEKMQKSVSDGVANASSKEKRPMRSSCFNNHFGTHYIGVTERFAAENGSRICPTHAAAIQSGVRQLLAMPESLVPSELSKDLPSLGAEVEKALAEFEDKHGLEK